MYFASTLPKPHKPSRRPKLCQRACKVNSEEKEIFKKCPTARQKTMKNLATNRPTNYGRQGSTGGNSVLPQLAVTCKIEAECSYQTFVQIDSVVLLNRQLRQHANRCM